jgi:hypothetical protein
MDMYRDTADSRDGDRLLSGEFDPGIDPGLAHLAALIAAAQAPASPSELMDEATVVAAMLKDLSPVVAFESRRASRIKKVAAAQIAAAALLAVTATTAAAAGTGSLPGPAQRAVSGAIGHIGIDVPNGHKHGVANGNGAHNGGSSDTPATTSGSGANGSGPNANAEFGLCTAFLAAPQGQGSDHSASADHSQSDNAAAFKALAAAHPDTTSYCNTVIQEKKATPANGQSADAPGNSGSTGQPASPGKSDSSGKPATPQGNSGQPQGKPATTPAQNGGKPSTTSTSAGTGSTATTNNGGHPQGGGAAGGGQPNRP